MYVRAFFVSLFFLFSLSFAIESLKNKDFHPNYKKTTLNQKVQQMETLELQFLNQALILSLLDDLCIVD